jgi:3-oxoacyl-[acyl-carrier-protein] synthase II
MGVITLLGHTVTELFTSQVAGRTAVEPFTRFDARTMPTAFASEVKGFQLDRYFEDATQYAHCGANTQFAIGATRQALEAAGLLGESTGDRA